MDRFVAFLSVGKQPHAKYMVESVKDVLKLPLVQMTDETTEAIPGVDYVRRMPYGGLLMPYRIEHLMRLPHAEMLILDTDILVKKPVDDVWERDFDVALTRRYNVVKDTEGTNLTELMPYNTGVMFSRRPLFWKGCYERLMSAKGRDWHKWYGDQMAVKWTVESGKYKVLELPCDEFNFTPREQNCGWGARIYHYKGNRKAWMESEYSSGMTTANQPPTTSVQNPSSAPPASP